MTKKSKQGKVVAPPPEDDFDNEPDYQFQPERLTWVRLSSGYEEDANAHWDVWIAHAPDNTMYRVVRSVSTLVGGSVLNSFRAVYHGQQGQEIIKYDVSQAVRLTDVLHCCEKHQAALFDIPTVSSNRDEISAIAQRELKHQLPRLNNIPDNKVASLVSHHNGKENSMAKTKNVETNDNANHEKAESLSFVKTGKDWRAEHEGKVYACVSKKDKYKAVIDGQAFGPAGSEEEVKNLLNEKALGGKPKEKKLKSEKQEKQPKEKKEKQPKEKKEKQPKENGGVVKRFNLFGMAATGVLRAMGKAGWTVKEAVKAMESLDIPARQATIMTQVGWGKKGDDSPRPIPTLTAEQWQELNVAGGKEQPKKNKNKQKGKKGEKVASE